MEDIWFNIFIFMIAFSFCWFVTKTFFKSIKEVFNWLFSPFLNKDNKTDVAEVKQELTEEEKDLENFNFNEKMQKGYLTAQEKELFRKKYLKK